MDLSSKHVSLLFLLTLFFSLQIHARENFSKFTHVVNNNNNAQDTEIPNKVVPLSKQQEEPNFTPQTQNGYGLYGHDSTQLTPTSTTPRNNKNNENSNNKDNYYYNKNEYEDSQQQDMIDTSLLGNGYTTPISNNQNNYYNGDNRYNTEPQQQQENSVYNRYNAGNRYNTEQQENDVYNRYNPDNQYNVGNRYNTEQQQYNAENRYNTELHPSYNSGGNGPYDPEKQGMSDTRYMENGRYYYDINGEKNYRRGYDNKGYYGNNENSYEFDKSGEEYQENQNGYP